MTQQFRSAETPSNGINYVRQLTWVGARIGPCPSRVKCEELQYPLFTRLRQKAMNSWMLLEVKSLASSQRIAQRHLRSYLKKREEKGYGDPMHEVWWSADEFLTHGNIRNGIKNSEESIERRWIKWSSTPYVYVLLRMSGEHKVPDRRQD